jgi:hypothetical protein
VNIGLLLTSNGCSFAMAKDKDTYHTANFGSFAPYLFVVFPVHFGAKQNVLLDGAIHNPRLQPV